MKTILFSFILLMSTNLFAQTDTLRKPELLPVYKDGGEAGIANFISQQLKYPESARRNDIEGIVKVQFVVDTFGKVQKVKVIKSINPDLDSAAIKVVSQLGDFVPGVMKGKKVKVYYTLPIAFSLDKPKHDKAYLMGEAVGVVIGSVGGYFLVKYFSTFKKK